MDSGTHFHRLQYEWLLWILGCFHPCVCLWCFQLNCNIIRNCKTLKIHWKYIHNTLKIHWIYIENTCILHTLAAIRLVFFLGTTSHSGTESESLLISVVVITRSLLHLVEEHFLDFVGWLGVHLVQRLPSYIHNWADVRSDFNDNCCNRCGIVEQVSSVESFGLFYDVVYHQERIDWDWVRHERQKEVLKSAYQSVGLSWVWRKE
jgi:hypothetical protein